MMTGRADDMGAEGLDPDDLDAFLGTLSPEAFDEDEEACGAGGDQHLVGVRGETGREGGVLRCCDEDSGAGRCALRPY